MTDSGPRRGVDADRRDGTGSDVEDGAASDVGDGIDGNAGHDRRSGTDHGSGTDHDTGGEIDRSPAVTSSLLSVLAALMGVATLGPWSRFALLVGALGVTLVAYGVVFGSRRRVTHGAVAIFVGVAVAAGAGAGAATLLPATLCALLAWDVGRYGVTVGEQLGRDADTARAELSHAALSTAVGAAGALVGYGAYVAVGGNQPVLAVALLLGGAVALVAVIR